MHYTPGPHEVYYIECEDGPYPGRWVSSIDQYDWPLPGIINGPGGRYFKGLEVSPDPEKGIYGTARYQWVADEGYAMMEAKNAQA